MDLQYKFILTGWRKRTGPKLFRFSLRPQHQPVASTVAATASLKGFSAYDLSSVEAIFRYLYADAGFLVRSTWLSAIKAGNYYSWPGLTYQNASKYYLASTKTLCGPMNKTWQGLRSTMWPCTKTRMSPAPPVPPTNPSVSPANELHISVDPISKLYTDNIFRFPVCSRRVNQ